MEFHFLKTFDLPQSLINNCDGIWFKRQKENYNLITHLPDILHQSIEKFPFLRWV